MAVNGARAGRKTGPSIMDVARLAGVSGQTVSRVTNGADSVRPETRDRVLRAMDQLGYSPNHAARALRHGRFGSIGLLAHRFDRTGEAMMTDAVLRAAAVRDLSVTLVSVYAATADGWSPAARRMQHQTVDGLIIIRSEGASTLPLSLPAGMPVAVADSRVRGIYPTVVADEIGAVRAAVDHLLDLGHRTVHHISGPEDSEPARVRRSGWELRLAERGVPIPPVAVGDWTAESGYRAGTILAADPEVTAILCANDETALGVLHALRAAGRHVPNDVSVVGYDGIALSAHSDPPLTTIYQDFTTMGTELVRLVVDQIDSHAYSDAPNVIVPSHLVVRESTAPPKRI
ncbi:LacI family DNA-binding transcriptional regulator [Demequina capsici]|uniref:LacI family DNA-binding transcriptional regulator n=1 Tax=Demequina capsici TaxID=3075620 RepID=A0AA96J6Q4_9MICO|nr:LacI family DNA-binding transcriptional regulator [Demequina sp. OYTSA14]WNM24447.1 LacI family DNA-binding transcriptional regulator [Demequina sp. OYTSA14]